MKPLELVRSNVESTKFALQHRVSSLFFSGFPAAGAFVAVESVWVVLRVFKHRHRMALWPVLLEPFCQEIVLAERARCPIALEIKVERSRLRRVGANCRQLDALYLCESFGECHEVSHQN